MDNTALLERKLAIAEKALRWYAHKDTWTKHRWTKDEGAKAKAALWDINHLTLTTRDSDDG